MLNISTITDLRIGETIEIKTRLNEKTVFTGFVMRAKYLKDCVWLSTETNLNLIFDDKDIIFYRIVKRFQDIYSYKQKTISLHPSTYAFLKENQIRAVVTYTKDKRLLNIASVADFIYISDLGIGNLRRARMEATRTFDNQVEINVDAMNRVMTYTTPPVIDELERQKKTAKTIEHDKNQGSLF